ncbi:YbaB/EbfC family nucleoid-associated protein [Nocardia sp. NPDC051787]|uniref:YbaB/EbfC family nucleoid-associated protein n=1 Tax=Nocardia sp. NPDC051787 TaxID=3155415 RepID=UPI003415EE7A
MAVFDSNPAAEAMAQVAADFERRAALYQELQGRMTALTVTESSSCGRISVTVDANGVPTAVNLSASTRGMDPAVVSAEIMSCLRRAQSKLRAQVTELVHNTVGDDPAGAAIVERFVQQFPDSEPSETASPEYPAPSYAPPPVPPTYTQTPSEPTEPAPWGSPPPPPSPPRSRKPNREQIVTPDDPDPEDEYYRRKSWLV